MAGIFHLAARHLARQGRRILRGFRHHLSAPARDHRNFRFSGYASYQSTDALFMPMPPIGQPVNDDGIFLRLSLRCHAQAAEGRLVYRIDVVFHAEYLRGGFG